MKKDTFDSDHKQREAIIELLNKQTEFTNTFLQDCEAQDYNREHQNTPLRGNRIIEESKNNDTVMPTYNSDVLIDNYDDQEGNDAEDQNFRPGLMIDLWKNLQDLLRNQFKEE